MSSLPTSRLFLAIPLTIPLALASCSIQKSTSAVSHSTFLHETGVQASSHISRLPFQHSWRDPNVSIDQFQNIVVRPVTLRHLKPGQWTKSQSPWITSEKTFLSQANKLSKFWHKSLTKSFSSPVCTYYLTQDSAKPRTLILEVAITEITFGRPTPSLASTPVPAGSLLNTANTPPLVAFEARVKDSSTGKIVATASDFRTDRLDVRNFSAQNFAQANQEICSQWSEQLMQATNRELFAKVKGSWFTSF